MRTVGVREFKARLSEELRAVSRGEVILVTDRGRVVAEVRAPGSASVAAAPRGPLEAWLREGRARIARGTEEPSYPASPVRLPPGTAERLLDEVRGEE